MKPDPTIAISWDYLIEVCDDGEQSDEQEPEVITLPPAPRASGVSPAPANALEPVVRPQT